MALIGIYTYILQWMPFVQSLVESIGSLPVVVTGSGVIIIVGVVLETLSAVESQMLERNYKGFLMD